MRIILLHLFSKNKSQLHVSLSYDDDDEQEEEKEGLVRTKKQQFP